MEGCSNDRFWRHLWRCLICRSAHTGTSGQFFCEYGAALYSVMAFDMSQQRRQVWATFLGGRDRLSRRMYLSDRSLGLPPRLEIAYL